LLPYDVDGGFRWTQGTSSLEAIPEPECQWPPTTSGPVAEDGRTVGPGTSLEDPVEFDIVLDDGPNEPAVPFGCPR
jgi:hypothetical protein